MRWMFLAWIALAAAAVAAPADAGPGYRHGRGGPPPGALIDLHAEELGLDEAQREAIRDVIEASHEPGRERFREVRAARRELHALLEAEPVDRDAVMEQVARVGELETEAEKHRIDSMLAIRAQLTPEQRAELVERRGRMFEHHFGPVVEACGPEIEALCEGHGPRAIPCLVGQREALEGACAEAVDGLPAGFGERGKGHHEFGPGCREHGACKHGDCRDHGACKHGDAREHGECHASGAGCPHRRESFE